MLFLYSEAASEDVVEDVFHFVNTCMMSQVRLWKIARTEAKVQNNMYYEINPKNLNLIGCWPMDEGKGNLFKDITENGHDATVPNGILLGWEPNIKFKKEQ